MAARRHLLFDLDGTLVDPAAGIIRSFRAGLTAVGLVPPPAETLHYVIGPPLRTSFPMAGVDGSDVERALEGYRATYRAGAMFEARPYDGIADVLARFASDGFTLHVATSKPHVFAAPILNHFGMAQHFAGVFGAELDGTRDAKSDVIAHLLATQGIAASTAIMIGDRKHDCDGASAHGIPTIGVAWGYGGRDELVRHGAAAIADRPDELLRLVATMATR
jgi:phosphoglycolate phosphatase